MNTEPSFLCQNRKLKTGTSKVEYVGMPCGELKEPVATKSLGDVWMCPKCDRQPGYRHDFKV